MRSASPTLRRAEGRADIVGGTGGGRREQGLLLTGGAPRGCSARRLQDSPYRPARRGLPGGNVVRPREQEREEVPPRPVQLGARPRPREEARGEVVGPDEAVDRKS